MSTSFSKIFSVDSMTVAARAVATIPTTSYCMIALDSAAPKALNIAGDSTIGSPSCGIASNSTATGTRGGTNGGTNIQGNATIGGPLTAAGTISEPGNPSIYSAPPFPMEGAPPVEDPYEDNGQKAWLTGLTSGGVMPGSCTVANRCVRRLRSSATVTYDANVLTDPIYFKDGATFTAGTTTLRNGVFYFDSLNLNNAATLITENATIVLFGIMDVQGTMNLTAPTSDSGGGARNSGWAVASPDAPPPTNILDVTGGNTHSLTGAIYAPNSGVKVRGNITSACAQIIAKKIDVGGTVALGYDGSCGGQDATSIGAISLTE